MQGYWSELGAAASVDWCEPNYTVTTYVAEFWNTLSSVPMALLGIYGMAWCYRQRSVFEPRFFWCFFALMLVGLGSMGFHGTMLKAAQAADELPMIYGGLLLTYCFINRGHSDRARERRWAIGFTVYAALFTVGYFALEDYFVWFIWSYAVIAGGLVLGAARLALGPNGTQVSRRLVGAAAGSFTVAFLVFWVPEHLIFSCDHPAQSLQLHSAWHILAGGGTYMGIVFAAWDRLQNLNLAAEVSVALPAPSLVASR